MIELMDIFIYVAVWAAGASGMAVCVYKEERIAPGSYGARGGVLYQQPGDVDPVRVSSKPTIWTI